MCTGHSIKRGSVQLYRSLSPRDEMVMEFIQRKGPNAYANYCAAYNDCAPLELPRFTSIEDYLKHASKIAGESENSHEGLAFDSFLEEMGRDELNDPKN